MSALRKKKKKKKKKTPPRTSQRTMLVSVSPGTPMPSSTGLAISGRNSAIAGEREKASRGSTLER
jgi:hypothetical protein